MGRTCEFTHGRIYMRLWFVWLCPFVTWVSDEDWCGLLAYGYISYAIKNLGIRRDCATSLRNARPVILVVLSEDRDSCAVSDKESWSKTCEIWGIRCFSHWLFCWLVRIYLERRDGLWGNQYFGFMPCNEHPLGKVTSVASIWCCIFWCIWNIVTWLILPVVICLSKRLSHACLSINKICTVKLRMAH